MREKLLNLMKEENLTSSRLAELLGIQPSGISHILKGRNNPSLDFIQKILRRFPQVNPDWLILGEGEMYRTQRETSSGQQGSHQQENGGELAANAKVSAASGSSELFAAATKSTEEESNHAQSEKSKNIVSEAESTTQSAAAMANAFGGSARSKVRRVIVLFEDRTFESYEVSN